MCAENEDSHSNVLSIKDLLCIHSFQALGGPHSGPIVSSWDGTTDCLLASCFRLWHNCPLWSQTSLTHPCQRPGALSETRALGCLVSHGTPLAWEYGADWMSHPKGEAVQALSRKLSGTPKLTSNIKYCICGVVLESSLASDIWERNL